MSVNINRMFISIEYLSRKETTIIVAVKHTNGYPLQWNNNDSPIEDGIKKLCHAMEEKGDMCKESKYWIAPTN